MLFTQPGFADRGDVALTEVSEQGSFNLITVAEDLDFAWDMEFVSDNELLLSEYSGSLRRLDLRTGQSKLIPILDVTTERGGLRGIKLHPDFESNQLIYFCYAKGRYEQNHTRISRARLIDQTLTDHEVIFDADNEARQLAHYGCRLSWLSDGTLVATLGDRRDHFNESQDLNNHYGTAIRLNDNGSVPADNPYINTPGVKPEIWAHGIRNAQGAVFHPISGDLWVSEHGPHGGDEINILRAGRNYGWPVATFGIDYDGTVLTDTPRRPEVEPPLFYWYPSIAPSSLAFYTGQEFNKWKGDLFVTSLGSRRLVRLELEANHVIATETLLSELDVRLRDIAMGPDGKFYLLTDTGDGRLFRLDMAETE